MLIVSPVSRCSDHPTDWCPSYSWCHMATERWCVPFHQIQANNVLMLHSAMTILQTGATWQQNASVSPSSPCGPHQLCQLYPIPTFFIPSNLSTCRSEVKPRCGEVTQMTKAVGGKMMRQLLRFMDSNLFLLKLKICNLKFVPVMIKHFFFYCFLQ